MRVTITDVGYRSTHYWVVSAGTSRMLIDIGWPGTLGTMLKMLKQMTVPIHELRYAFATHYHIDHAGLGEEMKRQGVPLLVLDIQQHAIPLMQQWTKPADNYLPITTTGNVVIRAEESRALLRGLGIAGELVPTPGHSDHCVSLLLDDGAVFTGDLPSPTMLFDNAVALESWRMLRDRGATRVYPAHGPTYTLGELPD